MRIVYGILFSTIILSAQLFMFVGQNSPPVNLYSFDGSNVQLSIPVPNPGGPYHANEGMGTRFNGSASRGSSGGSLGIDYIRMVNEPNGAPTDGDASMSKDQYGNVHIVWLREAEHVPGASGTLSLLYTRRDMNGSFTTPRVLRTNPLGRLLHTPSIATHEQVIYVAWGGIGGVFLIRSLDGGNTYEPEVVVYDGWGNSEYNASWYGVQVAVDTNGYIYIAWNKELPYYIHRSDLLVTRSVNGGLTFGLPVVVNHTVRTTWGHGGYSIAFDASGNLLVTWIDSHRGPYNVNFTISYDGGQSFQPPLSLTHNNTRDPVSTRLIVTSGGTIHVVWRDWDYPFPSFNISLSSSYDGGKTFSTARIVTDEPGYIDRYGIGLNIESSDNGTLYLFWSGGDLSHEKARLAVSYDDGITFSKSLIIDSFDSRQWCDDLILFDNASFAVLWTDESSARVPGKDYNVMYAEGSTYAPIVSYVWDVDASVDADMDGDPVNDADTIGPTPTVVYGDDGVYTVTLTVEDAMNRTASAQTYITVLNLPPTIEEADCTVSRPMAGAWARMAGEKWHDVVVAFYEDGVETANVTMFRTPGSPNDQEVYLGQVDASSGTKYSVAMWYTPEDDPVNGQPEGATPAWLVLKLPDGNETKIQHLFNVNHPETWSWRVDDVEDIVPEFVTCTAVASDPGSDDLTFIWDAGDGRTFMTIVYNNGVGPDPYPSPEVNPITATSTVTFSRPATSHQSIILTVLDDDGGSTVRTFSLHVRPADGALACSDTSESDWFQTDAVAFESLLSAVYDENPPIPPPRNAILE